MKKPKTVSKKAPRRSASKPKEEFPPVPQLSFMVTTEFESGVSIIIYGYKDGNMGIKSTAAGKPVEWILFTPEHAAAFLRTMAQRMIPNGIKLEDFL